MQTYINNNVTLLEIGNGTDLVINIQLKYVYKKIIIDLYMMLHLDWKTENGQMTLSTL